MWEYLENGDKSDNGKQNRVRIGDVNTWACHAFEYIKLALPKQQYHQKLRLLP
jgi:hypothetical protein